MTINQVHDFLNNCDNVTIITHKSPDGDTLGCGFALMNYIRGIGKKANVINNEPFPKRYEFLYNDYEPMDFKEKCVIAVDLADLQLLGSNLERYSKENAIDLSIDHHISNTFYAKETIVDGNAAAACEIMYDILSTTGVPLTKQIAMCLYTGIATDTGCFKYENTSPKSHIIASELMKYEIEYAKINRAMFDVKSKGRIVVEQVVNKNMEYYYLDKCSMVVITSQLIKESGIDPADFDGLSSMTLQIEGVHIGILVKQRKENSWKISVRTTDDVDASQFCMQFGGGGHVRAAGCQIDGTLEEVKHKLIEATGKTLGEI